MDVFSAHLGRSALLFSLAVVASLFLRCRRLVKRAIEAEAKIARLSLEAGALNDHLLQSLQGFTLTFHVAVQHVTCDQAAKQTFEKAFDRVDSAVIEGRARFRELELRPAGKDPDER